MTAEQEKEPDAFDAENMPRAECALAPEACCGGCDSSSTRGIGDGDAETPDLPPLPTSLRNRNAADALRARMERSDADYRAAANNERRRMERMVAELKALDARRIEAEKRLADAYVNIEGMRDSNRLYVSTVRSEREDTANEIAALEYELKLLRELADTPYVIGAYLIGLLCGIVVAAIVAF